jgi:quercetin 2,3-dioxygenase
MLLTNKRVVISMKFRVYPPHQQAVGAFDGGKITEQKPIGFPGEGSAVKRMGPLFYWSWAFSKEEGYIAPHPHQGFEIMTYVVSGQALHGDSLGTKSTVGPGGAQVMQTGSGAYHEERFIGPDMEGFQIWFEPYLREALKRKPTYNQYEHDEFPVTGNDSFQIKAVIGEGSPIQLVSDVKVWDIRVNPGQEFNIALTAGRSLAALAIRGHGEWRSTEPTALFEEKDFVVIEAEIDTEVVLHADNKQELRMILIEIPTLPNYPLYPYR